MSAGAGLDIGRRIKARRIALAIRKLGGGSSIHRARGLSDAEWTMADALSRQRTCGACKGARVVGGRWCDVCKAQGVVAPIPDHAPSPETRALVIEYLSRPEPPEVEQCPPRDEDVPA